MRVIRRFARQVAEKSQPDKIILFGSYAYGTPHEDSDVDILVIMPARNQLDQAFKIRLAFDAPFSMDLIVRTPRNMKWHLEERESFTTEIVTKGKVLFEKSDKRLDATSRGRPAARAASDLLCKLLNVEDEEEYGDDTAGNAPDEQYRDRAQAK